MILFIIIGLALILGVNWLYTRFGENPASGRRQWATSSSLEPSLCFSSWALFTCAFATGF